MNEEVAEETRCRKFGCKGKALCFVKPDRDAKLSRGQHYEKILENQYVNSSKNASKSIGLKTMGNKNPNTAP